MSGIDELASLLHPKHERKGVSIEASVEVERFNTGARRYEAKPVRMAVRGKAITFLMEDFVGYGWTRRGAKRRCLDKVVHFLREQAKIQEE